MRSYIVTGVAALALILALMVGYDDTQGQVPPPVWKWTEAASGADTSLYWVPPSGSDSLAGFRVSNPGRVELFTSRDTMMFQKYFRCEDVISVGTYLLTVDNADSIYNFDGDGLVIDASKNMDVVGGDGITANADDIAVDGSWLDGVIDTSDAALADSAAVAGSAGHDFDGDSINVSDYLTAEAEWIYLTDVHGFGRALTDSIYLYAHVQTAAGDSTYLLLDSAGNITAGDYDTVNVSGSIPFTGTMDSLEVLYKVSSGSEIVDCWLMGPDLSNAQQFTDSIWYAYATDLTATSWTLSAHELGDESVITGDRFSFKYVMQFDADNDILQIGWIRVRVTP